MSRILLIKFSIYQVAHCIANVTFCTKKEDLICPTKSAKKNCNLPIFRIQCPRKCGLCVDKHLVMVKKAREAMTEVVEDLISSISLTSNSTQKKNVNQVNKVMYRIERSIGQADLSRKKYKLPELKTDIKEAVKHGNLQFARRTLGIALHTIWKSSSKTSGRRKRSTKLDAKKFLEDLKKVLGDEMFAKLFAFEESKHLMFAIDTTGSMREAIRGAKAIATVISTYKRPVPAEGYILSPFGDPFESEKVIYKDKDQVNEFINEINNLVADGGGDCAEFAYQGMLAALLGPQAPVEGSPLFVFTDASTKNAAEDEEVLRTLAELYGFTFIFFTEENCEDPPNSTFELYKKLASATGGSYLPIDSTKLRSLAKFTDISLGSLTTVKAGSIDAKKRRKRSTIDEISIPVDDTISQLVVPVTSESSATGITLETPSGLAWKKETEGRNVAIYIIDLPSEGTWKLNVPASAGDYQYTVKALSTENIDFDFRYRKKASNRNTLELLHPLAGEHAEVDINIFGAKQIKKDSIRVDIVDISGKVLIPDIKPNQNDQSGESYSLLFDPPSEEFKMMVKGKTRKNKVFQRLSPHASQVKPLVLKQFYNSGRYSIKQGGKVFIILYLFNGMDTDQTFQVTLRDTLGYKISLLGSGPRSKVRKRSKKLLSVSVNGLGKRGKVGKTGNVIILVRGSHGTSATEIIQLTVKE